MNRVKIDYPTLHALFTEKLLAVGFPSEKADQIATIFTDNTCDGIISHGINRFPRFIGQIRDKTIDIEAKPTLIQSFGSWEQWDGNNGPGPLNATCAIERAMHLADIHGLGLVALRNTTHWMRGGTYGHLAAQRGYAAICWTNTMPNMSQWKTTTHTIGNNPLVMAVPGDEHPIVLDMAMSQYSYGKMETLAAQGEQLPYPGGFDREGKLTTEPKDILETSQVLPIGMWKGTGLSIMLDLFASMLSGGNSTPDISFTEHNCSQLYVAIAPGNDEIRSQWVNSVRHAIDAMQDLCAKKGENASYPGKNTAKKRQEALEMGMTLEGSMVTKVREL